MVSHHRRMAELFLMDCINLRRDAGYIFLGVSNDTSEFACECVRKGWFENGKAEYPNSKKLLPLRRQ